MSLFESNSDESADDALIAYLLGDMSPPQRKELEAQLAVDGLLRERLAELRQVMGHLDSLSSSVEPPADLVDQTLARIDREIASLGPDFDSPLDLEQPVDRSVAVRAGSNQVGLMSVGLTAELVSNHRRRQQFWDSPALALSLVALCCLILPAVIRARYVSRKLQCASNLQQTGVQLTDFAMSSPEQRIPAIPLAGPQAFAGYFTVRLAESGRPVLPTQLQCSSLVGVPRQASAAPEAEICVLEDSKPRYLVVDSAWLTRLSPTELSSFQRQAAGDYAYSLGIRDGSCVVAPSIRGQANHAILADTPLISGGEERFLAHDGLGVNILYEDGRVVFVGQNAFGDPECTLDDPFCNRLGTHEFGVSRRDASLAPSHFPPVAKQRQMPEF